MRLVQVLCAKKVRVQHTLVFWILGDCKLLAKIRLVHVSVIIANEKEAIALWRCHVET